MALSGQANSGATRNITTVLVRRGRARLADEPGCGDTPHMPGRNVGVCDLCAKERPTWALTKCPICGHAICQKCATSAYGRYFCSKRCAEFFFHDEGLQEEEGEET